MAHLHALRAREKRFSQTVDRWWKANRRDLPWRRTKDPYRILVSEVMLQQTQVDRVIPKYRAFLRQFPSVRALANGSRADVIRAWSGLGYNRRAVALHHTAQLITQNYRGRIPRDFAELMRLPGVGEYTARAILAFAYSAPYAPVDTNIRRIFIRHFGKAAERNPQAFANRMLRRVRPSSAAGWSQMLMDFGALVCTSRNPSCAQLHLTHISEVKQCSAVQPFKDSDRYWRGRIVDALRQHRKPVAFVELLTILPPNPQRSRIRLLLRRLDDEGIVEVRNRSVALAEHVYG